MKVENNAISPRQTYILFNAYRNERFFSINCKLIPFYTRIFELSYLFTFSSHTEYVKRESTVISRVKKKLFFCSCSNVHVLYVLEEKTSTKNVLVSVCLSGCTYVDFRRAHNKFRRSQLIQTKFGGCLLCMKCRSGIKIQSEIMILILILNRIVIFTKTLRSDTKFGEYLQYNIKNNFFQ